MESCRLAGSALSSPSTLPHGRFACFQCHDFSVCLIDIFVFFPDGGITATVLVHSDFSSRLPAPLSLSLSLGGSANPEHIVSAVLSGDGRDLHRRS